jgi:hypothetical protein
MEESVHQDIVIWEALMQQGLLCSLNEHSAVVIEYYVLWLYLAFCVFLFWTIHSLNWLFSALFWVFVCLALTVYATDAI